MEKKDFEDISLGTSFSRFLNQSLTNVFKEIQPISQDSKPPHQNLPFVSQPEEHSSHFKLNPQTSNFSRSSTVQTSIIPASNFNFSLLPTQILDSPNQFSTVPTIANGNQKRPLLSQPLSPAEYKPPALQIPETSSLSYNQSLSAPASLQPSEFDFQKPSFLSSITSSDIYATIHKLQSLLPKEENDSVNKHPSLILQDVTQHMKNLKIENQLLKQKLSSMQQQKLTVGKRKKSEVSFILQTLEDLNKGDHMLPIMTAPTIRPLTQTAPNGLELVVPGWFIISDLASYSEPSSCIWYNVITKQVTTTCPLTVGQKSSLAIPQQKPQTIQKSIIFDPLLYIDRKHLNGPVSGRIDLHQNLSLESNDCK